MNRTRKVTFRLNPEKADQRRLWEYLQAEEKSQSVLIRTALTEYFDRKERQENEPKREASAYDEELVSRIADAVKREIADALPLIIAGGMAAFARSVPDGAASQAVVQEKKKPDSSFDDNISDEYIDWDFLNM